MNRRKQRKQRINGIQTWMASPARVESAGGNFCDKLLNLCSLCFLLFKFISVFRFTNSMMLGGQWRIFDDDAEADIIDLLPWRVRQG